MNRHFGSIAGLVWLMKRGTSLIAALVVFLAGGLLVQGTAAADDPAKKDARPGFYLTPARYDGSEAAAACADGYHMASMWEILDPSNLRYNTTLGITAQDTGSGPPSIQFGWVRTARGPSTVAIEGVGNCAAWTSNSAEDPGTAVMLRGIWQAQTSVAPISPWTAAVGSCNQEVPVWCVQD